MPKRVKTRHYTIHYGENRLEWVYITEKQLLKLLDKQVLADGTLIHRDERVGTTYRVANYGTQLKTWHGHVVLDANKEA